MNWLLLADGPGYTGFFANLNTTLWSGLLRMAEAMVAAAPFLVAGVFAAGILRGMVGADLTRKILGEGHWSGPLRAWALGVLLPICSLGALPVARELRRAGISSGTVLSFVLVAPVLNPVSIIAGLSDIVPIMLVYFAAGTFAVSVGIGLVWNRVISAKKDQQPNELETAPRDSLHRLAVTGDTAARGLVGPVFFDYGLALLAVGFLGAFLPHGVLQTSLTRENPFAPVIMGLVAIPVYVTPTDVMMHFGHIVKDGYSLGAAFALIILGAGANVGVANWIRRDYGYRALSLFVALLIGSTMVIGLTADRTIIHGNATVKDHTHAFDPFTRLADVHPANSNISWLFEEVTKSIRLDEIVGVAVLAVLAIAGIILRLLGNRINVEQYLKPPPEEAKELTTPDWNPALSPLQLTLAGAAGIICFAVIGLYLYYPNQRELFEEMAYVRANVYEAIREEDVTEAKRRLDQWRKTLQKLPTSVLIREGSVRDSQRESVDEVLYALKTIEEFVETGRFIEALILRKELEKAYAACRDEYLVPTEFTLAD